MATVCGGYTGSNVKTVTFCSNAPAGPSSGEIMYAKPSSLLDS
jgi:hypothetical protein